MPLERYGVLKGSVVDARREDDPDSPHYQLHVRADDVSYRVAINVKSQLSPSELLFFLDDMSPGRLTGNLCALAASLTYALLIICYRKISESEGLAATIARPIASCGAVAVESLIAVPPVDHNIAAAMIDTRERNALFIL